MPPVQDEASHAAKAKRASRFATVVRTARSTARRKITRSKSPRSPPPGDVLHHGPVGETVFAVVGEVPLVATVRQAALLAQVLDQSVRLHPVEDHRYLGLSAEQAKRDLRPVPRRAPDGSHRTVLAPR